MNDAEYARMIAKEACAFNPGGRACLEATTHEEMRWGYCPKHAPKTAQPRPAVSVHTEEQ